MEIYSSVDNISQKNITSSSLTIGTFDGIHIGHQYLLKSLIGYSKKNRTKSVVITFSPNPYIVINNKEPIDYHLISNNEKYKALDRLGVDILLEIQFDLEMAKISASDFLENFIISPFNPQDIIIGYDHHFGYKREGDSDFLIQNKEKHGYNLHIIDPFKKKEVTVSSSMIRKLIKNNDIVSANSFLGRNYNVPVMKYIISHYGNDWNIPKIESYDNQKSIVN